MLNFKKISERIHYYLDYIKSANFLIKIDHFKLDTATNRIIVAYQVGSNMLISKMEILQFEQENFAKLSAYDRLRLVKFSTLQQLLNNLFNAETCSKTSLLNYLQREIKNEQLF